MPNYSSFSSLFFFSASAASSSSPSLGKFIVISTISFLYFSAKVINKHFIKSHNYYSNLPYVEFYPVLIHIKDPGIPRNYFYIFFQNFYLFLEFLIYLKSSTLLKSSHHNMIHKKIFSFLYFYFVSAGGYPMECILDLINIYIIMEFLQWLLYLFL